MHALDPHPLAIEQVTRKIEGVGLANVRLIRGDATCAGLATGRIDLVLLFGAIPSPVIPLPQLLPEMRRLLKPEVALAVWTAFPCWSHAPLSKSGLLIQIGEVSGVHSFRRATSN